MKNWYRIEFFDEDYMTCLPEEEMAHRVFVVER